MLDDSDVSIGLESGKIVFAPFDKPCDGPMSEYCLHLNVVPGFYGVWANSVRVQTKKGIKHRIRRLFLMRGVEPPTADVIRVAQLTVHNRLVVVGDLTFVHCRDLANMDANCPYMRGQEALRKRTSLGGTYTVLGDSTAVAIRVGIKEARLPALIQLEDGVFRKAEIDVHPAYRCDDD